MKILFTGASSFTGLWFVRELARAGHEVVAPLRRRREDYGEIRGLRVRQLEGLCRVVGDCPLGEGRFMELLKAQGPWDLLCHHAADVTNYKSPDFDPVAALANNTRNLRAILSALGEGGCRKLVLTGSVFEPGEGAGSDALRAVSPYGLSKGLTSQTVRYYAELAGFCLGKFVIPNPFGPYEEPRFTAYLARCWRAGQTARVAAPAYVRDNIHVSLLAKAYAAFVAGLGPAPGYQQTNPSGYVESMGDFTTRFAREMQPRLGCSCPYELAEQSDFPEPRVRTNTEALDGRRLGWDEAAAWDELAEYYRT